MFRFIVSEKLAARMRGYREQGYSFADIGAFTGVSTSTARKFTADVPMKNGRKTRPITRADPDRVLRALAAGTSAGDLAERFGVKRNSIYQIAHRDRVRRAEQIKQSR